MASAIDGDDRAKVAGPIGQIVLDQLYLRDVVKIDVYEDRVVADRRQFADVLAIDNSDATVGENVGQRWARFLVEDDDEFRLRRSRCRHRHDADRAGSMARKRTPS